MYLLISNEFSFKKKFKKQKDIFFAIIENDGFELGKNRRPIEKNDIPKIKSKIKGLQNLKSENNFYKINKEQILQNSKNLFLFVFIARVVDKTGRPARHKLHWHLIDQRVAGERGQSQRLYMGSP